MKETSYFTTGEFASLCNTTKETLRHYHNKGILSPKSTGENGYQYYSAQQFFVFDLIELLTYTGSSLKEVGEYLKHHNPDEFIKLLKEREQALLKEKEKIESSLRIVKNSTKVTNAAKRFGHGIFYQETLAEEYFASYEINPEVWNRQDALSEAMCSFILHMRAHGIVCEYPYSCIISQEDMKQGQYSPYLLTEKIDAPLDLSGLITKPAGTYLSVNHYGSYDSLDVTFQLFYEEIQKCGYQLNGPVYESELIGAFMTAKETDYVIKLSACIH